MPRKNRRLPRHLLVIRNSAMGDVAMLPHALRALRSAYPDLRITVATRELFRPFFDGLGVELLALDPKGRHKGIGGLLRFAREARALGVDAVADAHDVLRSQVIRTALRLHGLRVAVIDKGRKEKRRRLGACPPGAPPLRHTVQRYCDVFRRLGFVFPDPEPAPPARRPNPLGEKRGRWVGFAPFSAHPGKTYPFGPSERLVRMLSDRFDRVFIHSGPGAEAEWAAGMERCYGNVTALCGRVKLAGEIDLIANLDCVVAMDSLVMHLASLTGTPVVSVWGATHPALGFLGYGTDPAGVLQVDLACRPCSVYGNKPCAYGDYRCLRRIAPEAIADRVERLLDEESRRRSGDT